MTEKKRIDWTPEDLRNFRFWEKTERELDRARAELADAEKANRAAERFSFRRWIKDPLGRKWLREINRARSRVAEAQARTDVLDRRLDSARKKLLERLAEILKRAEEENRLFRTLRWLDRLERNFRDLEDLVERSLSAIGKTRNTMVHSYDRDGRAYPAEVIKLLRETAECTGHLKRKIGEYESLLGEDDRFPAGAEAVPFPAPPAPFPVASLDRMESRPVAVNARELGQLGREVEDLGQRFLSELKGACESARNGTEESFNRKMSRRLEIERLRIKER